MTGPAKSVRAPRPRAAARPPAPAAVATAVKGAPRNAREARGRARREAILSAALDEFSARGFAAARLDDVARRAGIAKGTIYLYFADKESLFQELVRAMAAPLIANLEAFAGDDVPFASALERLVDLLLREVIGTRRKDVIRLIIAEGPRFPALAQFYHREVLERVMVSLRRLAQRAYERGEIRHRALVDFPQLLAAPVVVAIVWNGLFETIAPLDARALLQGHLDVILDRRSEP